MNGSDASNVRERVIQIVTDKFGHADENLMASGIVDSLRAVELALELERAFGLAADSLTLRDMATVTAVTERILEAQQR